MKKLTITILLLLLASPCMAEEPITLARMSTVLAGGGVTNEENVSVKKQSQEVDEDYDSFCSLSSNVFAAEQIVATGPYTITSIKLKLDKIGSGQDVTGYVFDDNGGNPGTAYAASTVLAANIPTDDWVEFTFSSPPTAPDGVYWIGLGCPTYNASNRIRWRAANADNALTGTHIADSTPTWAHYGSGDTHTYQIYGY
jgi:hypothetical protein